MSEATKIQADTEEQKSEELFFRQIPSSWVTAEGTVAMAAFRPSTKDKRKLSLSSSEVFSAESAYEKHCSLGLNSGGSVAVADTEVVAAFSGLAPRDDGAAPPIRNVVRDDDPFDGHAHIDFTGLTKRECKSVAASLSSASNDRGWLHQPSRIGISIG